MHDTSLLWKWRTCDVYHGFSCMYVLLYIWLPETPSHNGAANSCWPSWLLGYVSGLLRRKGVYARSVREWRVHLSVSGPRSVWSLTRAAVI